MFIELNESQIVNLSKVSNINILNKNMYRIIFNLNYSIEINKNKLISDYVYWDFKNLKELNDGLNLIFENTYFASNFINNTNVNNFINVNEISSIKFIKDKLRIIFNLSNPITFTTNNNEKRITSEFVYSNCLDENQFNEYKDYVIKETQYF